MATIAFAKAGFDPDEPRIPKGDPHGGEWTSGEGGGGDPEPPGSQASDFGHDGGTSPVSEFSITMPGDAASTGDSTATDLGSEGSDNPPIKWEINPPESSGSTNPTDAVSPAAADGLVPAVAGLAGSEAEWLAALTPTTADALRQLLARMGGAGVVLGFLFVPTNRSPVVEGSIDNSPSVSYRFDGDMGILQLRQDIGSLGPTVVSEGHIDTDGLFRDSQGRVIGRYLAGSGVIIDAGALPGYRMLPGSATAPDAGTRNDSQPRLCPDPTPDRLGAPLDNAYQRYISILVNGRALPPGLAVSLFNPSSGKDVVFDDCRLTDGTMIEAKGDGYLEMLLKGPESMPWKGVEDKLVRQANSQLQAAQERPIEWYFKARPVADYVRELFDLREISITVIYAPQPE